MNISCMEIHIKKSAARWRPFVQVFQCITHWGQVTHTRISKLEHIWFRYWLVAWSAPSHCLNQCWNIVNWTLGNTQMHLKMSPAKSRPSLLDLSALTAAVATDSFDPVVHYVKVTHWQCFHAPFGSRMSQKISNHFSPKATCILRGLFG